MKLTISGTQKEFKDGITIRKIIELEKVQTPQYVTVSVNDELYSASSLDDIKLSDGDSVEFLYFMGGGC